MQIPSTKYIGTITKVLNTKPKIRLEIALEEELDIENLSYIFISLKDIEHPFFIEEINTKKKYLYCQLMYDVCATDIQLLEKSEVFANNNFIKSATTEELPVIIDYTVIDSLKGNIGMVKNVVAYPQQSIMEIDFNGKEILIPLNNAIVTNIDESNKTVFIAAPEGLIDVYLQ